MGSIECTIANGVVTGAPTFDTSPTGKLSSSFLVEAGDKLVRVDVTGEVAERLSALRAGDRVFCEGLLTTGRHTGNDGAQSDCLIVAAWKAEKIGSSAKR